MLSDICLIKEIYLSIQGEGAFAGEPCIFIRFSGCPLRCKWCDTAYAFSGGEELSVDSIQRRISMYSPIKTVEITGGEPLAQKSAYHLIHTLCDNEYKVMLETSGSEPIQGIDKRCHIIMDLKCPDSKMSDKNNYQNIEFLKSTDEIKFVVSSKVDFEWSIEAIQKYNLVDRCKLLLSPAWGLVSPEDLVSWMLSTRLPLKLNLQLHKYIWHPRKKGV